MISTGQIRHWTQDVRAGYIKPIDFDQIMIDKCINFWEISPRIRVILKPSFRKALFSGCSDLTLLAKKIKRSYSFTDHLRRGYYSIPVETMKTISDLSGVSMHSIQQNILCLRTRHGIKIDNFFPLKGNTRIASLVGHVFGDGYIGNNKRQFEYSNKNINLIKQVKNDIAQEFNLLPYTEKKDRLCYSSILGEILATFGSPLAPKIYSTTLIPEWILQSEEYSATFLKAFFDDDGSVLFSKKYSAKGVNLYIIRHKNVTKAAIELLNQIKGMITKWEIFSGDPIIRGEYYKKGGKRIIAYINITDKHSIDKFYSKIGMTKGDKATKLKKIVENKVRHIKFQEICVERKILQFLEGSKRSTASISNFLDISKAKALQKLKQLERKEKISKVGKVAANRYYLWKSNGGKQMC